MSAGVNFSMLAGVLGQASRQALQSTQGVIWYGLASFRSYAKVFAGHTVIQPRHPAHISFFHTVCSRSWKGRSAGAIITLFNMDAPLIMGNHFPTFTS